MTVNEADRIRAEYANRGERIPGDFYAIRHPSNLFVHQQRTRALLRLSARERLTPFAGKTILDIGCGEGGQLLDFETWGARRGDLAGIDLIETRVAQALGRLGHGGRDGAAGADVRVGDAASLPWPDEAFDIAHQSTVFTSITDGGMKRAVAAEILRVLKPGGVLVWYDFLFNNPRNPNVMGIGAREIRALFPGCSVRLRRITLAPPLARRLVPITWIGSLLLEKLVLLNTHYLGTIRKPAGRP